MKSTKLKKAWATGATKSVAMIFLFFLGIQQARCDQLDAFRNCFGEMREQYWYQSDGNQLSNMISNDDLSGGLYAYTAGTSSTRDPVVVLGTYHGKKGFVVLEKKQSPLFYELPLGRLGTNTWSGDKMGEFILKSPYLSGSRKSVYLHYTKNGDADAIASVADWEKKFALAEEKKYKVSTNITPDMYGLSFDVLSGTPLAYNDAIDVLNGSFTDSAKQIQTYLTAETNSVLSSAKNRSGRIFSKAYKAVTYKDKDYWKYEDKSEEGELAPSDDIHYVNETDTHNVERKIVNLGETLFANCQNSFEGKSKAIAADAVASIVQISRVTGDAAASDITDPAIAAVLVKMAK